MRKRLHIMALAVITTMLLFSCSERPFEPKLTYSTFLGSSGNDGANNWLKYFSIDNSGSVYFATSVYTDDFPVFGKQYKGIVKEVEGKSQNYNFDNLPEGEYALAIYQDENRNKILPY